MTYVFGGTLNLPQLNSTLKCTMCTVHTCLKCSNDEAD